MLTEDGGLWSVGSTDGDAGWSATDTGLSNIKTAAAGTWLRVLDNNATLIDYYIGTSEVDGKNVVYIGEDAQLSGVKSVPNVLQRQTLMEDGTALWYDDYTISYDYNGNEPVEGIESMVCGYWTFCVANLN